MVLSYLTWDFFYGSCDISISRPPYWLGWCNISHQNTFLNKYIYNSGNSKLGWTTTWILLKPKLKKMSILPHKLLKFTYKRTISNFIIANITNPKYTMVFQILSTMLTTTNNISLQKSIWHPCININSHLQNDNQLPPLRQVQRTKHKSAKLSTQVEF